MECKVNLKLELDVKLDFVATHTLEENEKVHEHRWRVDTTLVGENKFGRIVSLPKAQEVLRSVLKKIENTHLNSNRELDNATREVPTCENLAYYFLDKFEEALKLGFPESPSLRIVQIEVAVSEDDNREMGAARLKVE